MRGELTPLLAFLVAVVALAARCRRRCSDDAVGEAPGGVPIHETFEPSGDTRNTGVPSASAIATTSAAPPGPRACSPSQTATSTSQCPASPRAFRWRLAWVSPADLGDDELATVRLARGDHGPELRSDAVRPRRARPVASIADADKLIIWYPGGVTPWLDLSAAQIKLRRAR